MAAAGIIHGNGGTKTDGSGGVDFVEEGEETRERRGVEKIIRGDNFRCAMGVTQCSWLQTTSAERFLLICQSGLSEV